MVVLFARSGAAALVLSSVALGLPTAAHAPQILAARHQSAVPAALGAGSWAQARSLRIASVHLTARLSRAARCDPAQDKTQGGPSAGSGGGAAQSDVGEGKERTG